MKIKEKIKSLMEALAASENLSDMIEEVKDTIHQCNDYVAMVANEESSIQMARIRLDPADYRAFVMNVDRNRRFQHQSLMVSMNMLNRLAKMLGTDEPFTVDVDDRESYYQVAKQVVDEYFTTGQAGSATASVTAK